ncbi:MAG: endonuclease NucS [Candidatus Bathyarchaeota archaeon]|nr:MAG: endonuclease NucS [Candidatus Bathyarchaeota archaeon]
MLEVGKERVVQRPKINEESKVLIERSLAQHRMLLLVGKCQVVYQGRASSRLNAGDRLIMIKQDRSLLVHRPIGHEAINWQLSGCVIKVRIEEGNLAVTSIHRRPHELVEIRFSQLYLIVILNLKDHAEFTLHATEEDMQKAILREPSILEDGFVPVSFEKKVEPGFVDIYGVDAEGKFTVVEIKRKAAGRSAVLQLSRYVKTLRENDAREVRGILVAPEITKGCQRLLESLKLSFKPINPQKCASILHRSKTLNLIDFIERVQ